MSKHGMITKISEHITPNGQHTWHVEWEDGKWKKYSSESKLPKEAFELYKMCVEEEYWYIAEYEDEEVIVYTF